MNACIGPVIYESNIDRIQIVTCSTKTDGDIEQNITKWRYIK